MTRTRAQEHAQKPMSPAVRAPKGTRRPPGHVEPGELAERITNAVVKKISFRPAGSAVLATVPIEQAGRIDFREADPTRKPIQHKGQWKKVVERQMKRSGQVVVCDSKFESQHMIIVDHDPSVTAVLAQPFRIHWLDEGRRRVHVPDFLVFRQGRRPEVLDVRSTESAAKPKSALVFGMTGRACELLDFGYQICTDIDPVVLTNLRWLDAYRRVGERIDPEALAGITAWLWRATVSPSPYHELVRGAATATGNHVFYVKQVIFYRIWDGLLHVDLTRPFVTTMLVGRTPFVPIIAR